MLHLTNDGRCITGYGSRSWKSSFRWKVRGVKTVVATIFGDLTAAQNGELVGGSGNVWKQRKLRRHGLVIAIPSRNG